MGWWFDGIYHFIESNILNQETLNPLLDRTCLKDVLN